MKAHTDYLWFHTPKRRQLINITHELESILEKSSITEGMMLVSAMHITAGIWVNDDESGLHKDLDKWLDMLAPPADYEHHKTGEDNGDAHLKRSLLGHQTMLPITGGKLDLGPWETIFYAEFDGQRKKRVVVKIIGE